MNYRYKLNSTAIELNFKCSPYLKHNLSVLLLKSELIRAHSYSEWKSSACQNETTGAILVLRKYKNYLSITLCGTGIKCAGTIIAAADPYSWLMDQGKITDKIKEEYCN